MTMSLIDAGALRQFIYRDIIANGLPPTSDRVASEFGVDRSTALRSIAEAKIGKTILAHPATGEIWMAGPFASSPGRYRVSASGVDWWGNCAWDMLGVAAIVDQPVHFEASCCCCDEPFAMDCDPRQPLRSDWVVHFLLPAHRWYEDIGFT